jgi:hypothetical protein
MISDSSEAFLLMPTKHEAGPITSTDFQEKSLLAAWITASQVGFGCESGYRPHANGLAFGLAENPGEVAEAVGVEAGAGGIVHDAAKARFLANSRKQVAVRKEFKRDMRRC